MSVYFDNLQVTQAHGRIIEEDHYYAYGLKIAAISSRKLGDVNEGYLKNNNLYNDKEFFDDGDLNWYDYGFRNYDPQIGRFTQLDPLTGDYPELTPYQYASNDPILNIDLDGLEGVPFNAVRTLETITVFSHASQAVSTARVFAVAGSIAIHITQAALNLSSQQVTDQAGSKPVNENAIPWILYNGTKVIIYDGKFGDTKNSTLVSESNGTSGLVQVAENQTEGGGYPGPVPEGNYKINLELNPNREVKIDYETGLTNQGNGIEKLPKKVILNNGQPQTYEHWGTIRARLEKDPGNPKIKRDNFYLHDSDKGYSHGCIECSKKKIFDTLLKYRAKGLTKIRVVIKYPNPKTITNGGLHGK